MPSKDIDKESRERSDVIGSAAIKPSARRARSRVQWSESRGKCKSVSSLHQCPGSSRNKYVFIRGVARITFSSRNFPRDGQRQTRPRRGGRQNEWGTGWKEEEGKGKQAAKTRGERGNAKSYNFPKKSLVRYIHAFYLKITG